MTASKRPRFADLERVARERAYTLKRVGREIFWWRNADRMKVYSSLGVAAAMEDVLLDSSSKKADDGGTSRTHGDPK